MRQYISSEGLINRRSLLGAKLSLRRLSFILTVLLILILTNPANEIGSLFSSSSLLDIFKFRNKKNVSPKNKNRKNHSQDLIGCLLWDFFRIDTDIFDFTKVEKKWHASQGVTNYGILTVREKTSGVNLGILSHEIPICTFGKRSAWLCDTIAKYLCHGTKLLDTSNRPLTALRIIQFSKIMSYILSWCCIHYDTWCPSASIHNFELSKISPFLSLFHQTNFIAEYVNLSVFLPTMLYQLDRIVQIGSPNDQIAFWHFYGAVFIFIIFIGGLANLFASYMTGQSFFGMKGSIASSLGYILAVSPKKTVCFVLGVSLNAGDVLVGFISIALLSVVFGTFPVLDKINKGDIISWTFGGFMGNALCKIQLEKYGIKWAAAWL